MESPKENVWHATEVGSHECVACPDRTDERSWAGLTAQQCLGTVLERTLPKARRDRSHRVGVDGRKEDNGTVPMYCGRCRSPLAIRGVLENALAARSNRARLERKEFMLVDFFDELYKNVYYTPSQSGSGSKF